jgi:hypothetical protein
MTQDRELTIAPGPQTTEEIFSKNRMTSSPSDG